MLRVLSWTFVVLAVIAVVVAVVMLTGDRVAVAIGVHMLIGGLMTLLIACLGLAVAETADTLVVTLSYLRQVNYDLHNRIDDLRGHVSNTERDTQEQIASTYRKLREEIEMSSS